MQHDAYYTPDALARACVAWLSRHVRPRAVIEPSVGGGAFVRACREVWPRLPIAGCDVDPNAAGLALCDASYVGDWLTEAPTMPYADLVIGNPPYAGSEAHVEAALSRDAVVAMLLRASWAWSNKRADLLARRPPSWIVALRQRPSFTSDGKADSADYALFVWLPAYAVGDGVTRFEWLDWRGPRVASDTAAP